MDFFYKPTGQVVSGFQVLSMTGLNVETACLENLQEVGVYPLVDEMKEGLLDNPEPSFVEENGVFYKRNSKEPLPLEIAKAKAFIHVADSTESELDRLMKNAGLGPLTLVFFHLFHEGSEEVSIPGLDSSAFKELVLKRLHTLNGILNAKTTKEIEQMIEETVQS